MQQRREMNKIRVIKKKRSLFNEIFLLKNRRFSDYFRLLI